MGDSQMSKTSTVQMDDGVRLHVKLLGEDSNPTKPLLIAHHGAPGLSTHLEPESTFGFLSGIFRVLVFDARGSGVSDLTGPYTHDRWIKDIETLRQVKWRPSNRRTNLSTPGCGLVQRSLS